MPKNILIVSASSSLARPLLNRFLEKGFDVFATFNKKKIYVNHSNLTKIKLDILNLSDYIKFKKIILKKKFDSIIFCNGYISGKSFSDTPIEEALKTYNINLIYPLHFLNKIRNNLSFKSKVIFISSVSAHNGSYDPFYASSKAALNMAVKCIARDPTFKKKKIMTISPSLIMNSHMYDQMSEENKLKHIKKNPLKKLIKINDLADLIFIHATKDNWDHNNGSDINFFGGI